jgi:hypothetical protein
MGFAVAKFLISKDDLYAVREVAVFDDKKAADEYFIAHRYDEEYGGTWQERWEYHVVEVRNGAYYRPHGPRIRTVLDHR